MPGLRHDSVVELFRNCGGLALELIGPRDHLPTGAWVSRPLTADFTQPLPTELRADHVTAYYREGAGEESPALAIIIEVQLQVDEDKQWRWAAYIANAAARFRCPVVLLVVTPDSTVATWARGPFPTGHPAFDLVPIVIDLSALPKLLEPQLATRLPELAVLCAMAHPDAPTRNAAFDAISALSPSLSALYLRFVMTFSTPLDSFFADVRRVFGPEMEQKLFDEYLEQLRQQIQVKAEKDAELKLSIRVRLAQIDLLRETALEFLHDKSTNVLPEQEAAIREVSNVKALKALVKALAKARNEEEARAVLSAAKAPTRQN